MRFNSTLAQRYRKNGIIRIVKDIRTGYYDMYILFPNGRSKELDMHPNKQVLINEAKKLAMEHQLGFNKETDVVI